MRLTIDGRNVEAAEGMTILAAAKTAGNPYTLLLRGHQ